MARRLVSPAVRTVSGSAGRVNTADLCNKGLLGGPMLLSKEEGCWSTVIHDRLLDGGDHDEGLSLLDISER